MKFITITVAVFIIIGASAEDFHSRVQAGKQALQTPEGKAYEKTLGPTIARAIRECIPPGSPPQPGDFALVGYVNASGSVLSVEVQPSTAASQCLAEKISNATLPVRPSAPKGFGAFPITIEMHVVP